MKVVTVVGTRPELIKLSCVIQKLDEKVEHILIHTGQNYDYELNEIFFQDLEIRKPNYFLNTAQGKSAIETVSQVIAKTEEILIKEKPNAFLLLGDTNSCLSAYAAKRLQIPIFHMEAGNRCFDMRVPEEINRKIVDHISDINLVYTEHARRYLLQEGLPGELIIKTGSPLQEIYNKHMQKIKNSDVINRLSLEKNKYFIVSLHREENVDYQKNFESLLESVIAIEKKYKMPIIVSTHPRTKLRLQNIDKDFNNNIRFLPPLSFSDYVHLQMNAYCTISDSGSLTEEASILGFPAITVRQTHERPEGMDEGTIIMTGLNPDHILLSIDIIKSSTPQRETKIVVDYTADNVSLKVLRIIMSYTDYVNRVIWRKESDFSA